MLSKLSFTYYQPDRYSDDGTNVEYLGMPEGLFSFQAFLSEEACIAWLENNGYEPGDFTIHEYSDDDIEGVTIIDEYGDVIPKIEDLSDEEMEDLLADEVLIMAGSIDNLHATRQSNETEDQFKDRVYDDALDEVNAAIIAIEEHGEYNFQAYCGTPDVEWYDEARDEAVRTVMNWMLEDYPY
jgi:hypothetical protein